MASDSFEILPWREPWRLDAIVALVHAAFDGLEPPSSVLNETAADFAARQRAGLMFVACAGDVLIGSVFAARKDDSLYITRLAVLPSWRRRGVAHALMDAIEREARASGCARLTLRVRTSLPDNRAFFERMGFVVTGEGQDPGLSPYYVMQRPFDA